MSTTSNFDDLIKIYKNSNYTIKLILGKMIAIQCSHYPLSGIAANQINDFIDLLLIAMESKCSKYCIRRFNEHLKIATMDQNRILNFKNFDTSISKKRFQNFRSIIPWEKIPGKLKVIKN